MSTARLRALRIRLTQNHAGGVCFVHIVKPVLNLRKLFLQRLPVVFRFLPILFRPGDGCRFERAFV